MKQNPSLRVFVVAVLLLANSSLLPASETDASTADSSPGVIVKVKKAIEHGAKATVRGIERGANATARGIKRGANATRNAAHKVADKLKGSSDESAASSSEK